MQCMHVSKMQFVSSPGKGFSLLLWTYGDLKKQTTQIWLSVETTELFMPQLFCSCKSGRGALSCCLYESMIHFWPSITITSVNEMFNGEWKKRKNTLKLQLLHLPERSILFNFSVVSKQAVNACKDWIHPYQIVLSHGTMQIKQELSA